MQSQFLESKDTFKISFGGQNSIDAELFTKTINNTIELVKASANVIDPAAFLRLEIKANKEGSFETIIDAITRCSTDLLTKDNIRLACEIVGGYLAFLQIKQHLKGKKPKEVNTENNNTKIVNQDNIVYEAPQKIADAFFKDSKIENSIVNIFCDLKSSNRENFNIYKDDSQKPTISIPKAEYDSMSNKTFNDNQQVLVEIKADSQTVENCELIIKKPDLIGDSKWELIYDKIIFAKIEDENFLQKIKNGTILVSGGYRLVCSLQIKREIDKNYNLVNVEYHVVQVKGIKNKTEQLDLFD